MKTLLFILVLLALTGVLYIRLAPNVAERWHIALKPGPDRDFKGGVRRSLPGDAAVLARLDKIIHETPRTRRLAGTPQSGRVSYVTRSRVFGFPDYTTIELRDGQVLILARLRFGTGDLGVNRARVERWLAALAAG